MPRSPWHRHLDVLGVYLFLAAMTIFSLLPFAWPFISAFGTKPENVSGLYLFWPVAWTLEHFREAIWGRGEALLLMRNSLISAGGSVMLAVIVCVMGGYSLSRGQFRFKRALMFGILLIQIIPQTATVLPYYLIMRDLGMVNTLTGVTLGLATGQLPFMLWVMKGFFDTVPVELEEAAWLDGAGRIQTMARIVMPLALPGVGAATVLAFRATWGTFFLPLILLSDADKFVMPLGLFRAYIAYTNIDYGMMNAVALLYMLPSFLIFFFARQYLIRGTMAGAMAGQ